MSFYTTNIRSNSCPGVISGNNLSGICERACIHTQKVLDACLKQVQQSMQVSLSNQSPASPTAPLTFVSATTSGTSSLNNLIIERLVDRPNFARVSGDVTIPLIITYTDANDITGTGQATLTVPFDVILFVPQPSIVPFTIEAFGSSASPSGTYISGNVFNINACVTIIIKVVVEADILVPSYGYCHFPPCQDYTQDACGGFFDLPLFPTAVQTQRPGV